MAEDCPKGHYVYVLFRPWNGIPCYVGQGVGRRAWKHQGRGANHPNAHLAAIFSKANGEVPVVIVREGLTQDEALQLEVALIAAIGRGNAGPLANLTDGGEGTVGLRTPKSAEHRRKIGEAQRGKKIPPAVIQKILETKRARPVTAAEIAHRQALVDNARARKVRGPQSAEWRQAISDANRGRKMTSEQKLKMSVAGRGRVKPEEHRQKIGQALRGKPKSKEHKQNLKIASAKRWARFRAEREASHG